MVVVHFKSFDHASCASKRAPRLDSWIALWRCRRGACCGARTQVPRQGDRRGKRATRSATRWCGSRRWLECQSREENSDGRPAFWQPEVGGSTRRRRKVRSRSPRGGHKRRQPGISQVDAGCVLSQRLRTVIACLQAGHLGPPGIGVAIVVGEAFGMTPSHAGRCASGRRVRQC